MSIAGPGGATTLGSVKVLVDAGVVRPMRPDRLVRVLTTLARWGRSPAAGSISLADRFPDETAIIDELGTLTFAEVHTRTNALAHALSDRGINEGDGVGIMCRNHRGFIEATVAVSKLGRRRALPEHRLRRAAADRGGGAREAGGDHLRRGVRRAARGRRQAAQALRRLARLGEPARPHARRADRRRRPRRRGPARRARAARSSSPAAPPARPRAPRAATRSRSTRPCRCCRRSRCTTRQTDPHRRAAVPLLGLRPLHARAAPRLDLRAAAQVRPRGTAWPRSARTRATRWWWCR